MSSLSFVVGEMNQVLTTLTTLDVTKQMCGSGTLTLCHQTMRGNQVLRTKQLALMYRLEVDENF